MKTLEWTPLQFLSVLLLPVCVKRINHCNAENIQTTFRRKKISPFLKIPMPKSLVRSAMPEKITTQLHTYQKDTSRWRELLYALPLNILRQHHCSMHTHLISPSEVLSRKRCKSFQRSICLVLNSSQDSILKDVSMQKSLSGNTAYQVPSNLLFQSQQVHFLPLSSALLESLGWELCLQPAPRTVIKKFSKHLVPICGQKHLTSKMLSQKRFCNISRVLLRPQRLGNRVTLGRFSLIFAFSFKFHFLSLHLQYSNCRCC